MSTQHPAQGFTLIEMIMVIVITGIIGGMVAVFIRAPVEGYVDAVRRAELTDQADVALRRVARDVRLSLPNSLRVTQIGGVNYIEFIMTKSGGRYRDDSDGSTGGDVLNFLGDTTFDVLGPAPTTADMAAGDYIVIYNDGTAPADAYSGGNRALIGIAGSNVTLGGTGHTFPLRSPSSRFQVIPGNVQAVTYACSNASSDPPPASAFGNLERYWNYGFNPTQVAPSGTPALLAGNVACEADYQANATGRNGLLYVRLWLRDAASDERVSLFTQIHIDNAP